ncbi:MAG: bifunctional diguanylate cyclase/phosphodiesterase [Hydrogenimonas sp.]|nr:bifunctional diguanylate cyclase/phosphodiesterase [Hydrogenimonas sp.]
MKSLKGIYLLLALSITASIIYLHYGVNTTHTKLVENIEKIFVLQAKNFAKNIDEDLKKYIDSNKTLYQTLKEEPQLRAALEHSLSTISTPSFKYIFVLYRDKDGRYRYLLDGSREDKGFFNQKLDVDKNMWNRCYETKEDQIIVHKNLEGLWITYLKPIVRSESVEGVIAIDFSTTLPATINEAIKPLEKIFYYIFIAIGALMLILLYQTILNIKVKKESITDPLTQTLNRNFLKTFLSSIDLAKYQILMVDIDYFKKINDNFGHKAGDLVLKEVAALIKKELREKDKLIRFGGEEFLIFLYREKHNCTAAKIIANRLKERIEKHTFKYEKTPIHITVSIGAASKPEHFKSADEAVKYADELLYEAKREGRNKIVFDIQNNEKSDKFKTLSEVKEALDEDRVIVHYQPIVDLASYKTVKYEALVRIVERDGKIVPPFLFLDSIAHTNIYVDLTKRILSIVFDKIKEHKISISINLNLSDILDNMIFSMIIEEIKKHEDLAKWLIIEMLETQHYSNIDSLKDRILELKSFGVKISVDDFGSGFSNFSIFQDLPIDILKIDGSLVKDVNHSKVAYSITESISLFANKLDIEVIAEFIHSKEILYIVKDLGILYGQGFYLGKPQESIDTKKSILASQTSA